MLDKCRKSLISKGIKITIGLKGLFSSLLESITLGFFIKLCHILETIIAFNIIPTLRSRPKYKVPYGSLVVEDFTQKN